MLLSNGEDGTHYPTHSTSVLNLWQIVNYFKLLNDDNVIHQNIDEDLVPIPSINDKSGDYTKLMDYIYRDLSLQHLNFYDFIWKIDKRKKRKSNDTISNKGRPKSQTYNLINKHLQSESHELFEKKEEEVAIILGTSIPRKNDSDNRGLYCKLLLSLFKPFRSITDLINNEMSWDESFRNYMSLLENEKNIRILKLINNIEYLKKSENDAEEEHRIRKSKKDNIDNQYNDEDIEIELNDKPEEDEFVNFFNSELDQDDIIDNISSSHNEHMQSWTDEAVKHFCYEYNRDFTEKCFSKDILLPDTITLNNVKKWKNHYKELEKQIDDPVNQIAMKKAMKSR